MVKQAVALMIIAASAVGAPHELRIAVAADLEPALKALIQRFEKERPEYQVRASLGSSGNFFAQISQGAPFGLFLSANQAYARGLVEKGVAKDLFPYATGRLVVWVSKASPLHTEQKGLKTLLAPQARRIAIANPAHAPYGKAAVAALKTAGLYDKLKDRLVPAENIAEAAQFAASGAADAAVIALSLALTETMKEKGRYWEIPAQDYPEIDQSGVVCLRGKDPAAALAFRAFLTGPEGQKILSEHGFGPPRK